METKCYVLVTSASYSDGDETQMFLSRESAENFMNKDYEKVKLRLTNLGYKPITINFTYGKMMFVPDTGINYGWNIHESTIF